eukprot:2500097-Alexandrium_andersonii.AAC.1
MDPPALGPGVQEQLGQTRMLADRTDPCLVRPLSHESIEHMGGMLAIEEVYENLGGAASGGAASSIQPPSTQ